MTPPLCPFTAKQPRHFRSADCILRLLALVAGLSLATACSFGSPQPTPIPSGSCTLELPYNATDEQAIRAVLAAEGAFVVTQEITALMALWAEDGFVADAKNTSDNSEDDQRWLNKDAIRHRYVRTVFPGAPSQVRPADLKIVIDDEAAVVYATTNIGSETAPAGDRWELVKVGDCWQLTSLTYNLEARD